MGDGVDQDVGQLAEAGFGLGGIERADRRAGRSRPPQAPRRKADK
jgi:hypothetical protein